ncbi:MAG: DUF5663 domain-containing protein [Patescibacteria group bacterium]
MHSTFPQGFDDIFAPLGLSHLSAEEKQKMLSEMQEIVENRVTLRILDSIPVDQRPIFEKLEKDEEFTEFLKKHNIDPVAISLEEGMKFREELVADSSFIQGQIEARMENTPKAD